MNDRLHRVVSAAAILSISRSKCYQLVRDGVLPHLRVDRSIRIPAAALDQWIADQTIRGPESGGAARRPRGY